MNNNISACRVVIDLGNNVKVDFDFPVQEGDMTAFFGFLDSKWIPSYVRDTLRILLPDYNEYKNNRVLNGEESGEVWEIRDCAFDEEGSDEEFYSAEDSDAYDVVDYYDEYDDDDIDDEYDIVADDDIFADDDDYIEFDDGYEVNTQEETSSKGSTVRGKDEIGFECADFDDELDW